MYKIKILHYEKQYLLEELIKVFLRPDQYRLLDAEEPADADTILINEQGSQDKNEINRQIYRALSRLTGKKPAWGILTGIRPVKLCGELFEKTGSGEGAVRVLREDYYLNVEKRRCSFSCTCISRMRQESRRRTQRASISVFRSVQPGASTVPSRRIRCRTARSPDTLRPSIRRSPIPDGA